MRLERRAAMGLAIGDVVLGFTVLVGTLASVSVWRMQRSRVRQGRNITVRDPAGVLRFLAPCLMAVFIIAAGVARYQINVRNLATNSSGSPQTLPSLAIPSGPIDGRHESEVQDGHRPDSPGKATQAHQLPQKFADQDRQLFALHRALAKADAMGRDYGTQLGQQQLKLNRLAADLNLAQQVAARQESELKELRTNLERAEQRLKAHSVVLARRDQQISQLRSELAQTTAGGSSASFGIPSSSSSNETARPTIVNHQPQMGGRILDESGWYSLSSPAR